MPTVLVVDDEYSIVETIAEILAWEGYAVLTASNGREGLNELTKRPDVVLLDYMMPILDGLQMLKTLRKDPDFETIPVILMTAAPLQVAKRPQQWDLLLPKPFTQDQLLAALDQALKKKR